MIRLQVQNNPSQPIIIQAQPQSPQIIQVRIFLFPTLIPLRSFLCPADLLLHADLGRMHGIRKEKFHM
jgi:hypothetical protein